MKYNYEQRRQLVEQFKRENLLDFCHTVENLMAKKPVRQTITDDEIELLDYLFGAEPYPIEEDRDYRELGEIFDEDD